MENWELSKLGREYYRVTVTTVPAITDWEISFDHGTTWVDLFYDINDDKQEILVAGPDFVPPQGDVAEYETISTSVVPYIRAIDSPEVLIRNAPKIELV